MSKRYSMFLYLAIVVATNIVADEQKQAIYAGSFDSSGDSTLVFIGNAVHIREAEYEKTKCGGKACFSLPAWQIYEIDGWFLSDKNQDFRISVAQWGTPIMTDWPWLVRLEPITDPVEKQQIGASYKIKGVNLGGTIFCPKKHNLTLFKKWKADFIDIETQTPCYAI